MANAKTAPQTETQDWEEQLAAAEKEGRAIEAGEFFKFKKFGDHCVGKLVEIQEPRGKMKSPVAILIMASADGVEMLRPIGISGNLEGLISPNLLGHYISVWYVADKDVRQPQPMKVYRVIDHGDRPPRNVSNSPEG